MSFSGTDGGSGQGSSDAICQVFRTSARKNRHRTSATGHRGLAVQHLGVASARGFCSCVATAASTGNVLILSPFSLLVSLILPSCVPNFISPRGTVWTFRKTLFCDFFFYLSFLPLCWDAWWEGSWFRLAPNLDYSVDQFQQGFCRRERGVREVWKQVVTAFVVFNWLLKLKG